MEQAFFAFLGCVILITVFMDAAATAVRSEGGGRLTRLFVEIAWRALIRVKRRRKLSHRTLSYAGTGFLLMLLLVWVGLVWLGWTLVFYSNPHAVVSDMSGEPATFLERLYFAGSTVLTLGLGDFRPNGTFWELLTIVAGISGYSIAALSVAYILPVFQAAIKKREMAMFIGSLGDSPQDIVCNYARTPETLQSHLNNLTKDIFATCEAHRAYPVLHFFHSSRAVASFSLKIATLDETLTILQSAFKRGPILEKGIAKPLRRSISLLLNTIEEAHMEPSEDPPPFPDPEQLRDHHLELVSEVEYIEVFENLLTRRKALRGLVTSHGWSWDELYQREPEAERINVIA